MAVPRIRGTARLILAAYLLLVLSLAVKGFVPGFEHRGFYGVGVGEWSMFSTRVQHRPVEVFVDGERSDRKWLWHANIVQASRAVYDQRVLDALAEHIAAVTGEPVEVHLWYRFGEEPEQVRIAEATP